MDLMTVDKGMVVPRIILFVIMAVSCRSDAKPTPVTNRSSVVVVPAPADEQARARNYLGVVSREDADYGRYLRLEGLRSGAMYDGLRWIRVCGLTRHDSTVSFSTAEMFGGVRVFEGVSDGDGLRGELTYRPVRGSPRSWGRVVFRPLDDPLPGDRSLGRRYGFYSDLRYSEATGDNGGTELLVASTAGKLTVALAIIEGTVSSPFVGFNHVEIGDTVRFQIWRKTPAPTVRAIFVNGFVEVSLSDWVVPPSRLPRKFSLRSFFEQPPIGRCTG